MQAPNRKEGLAFCSHRFPPLCEQKRNVGSGPLPRSPLSHQELQLREAQNENARLVEENSRLSGRATEKEQVQLCPAAGWFEGYCFLLLRKEQMGLAP